MKTVSIIIILVALSPVSAFTQTVSEEIVVTASALPESSDETPAAITVVTREDIERRAARDVADVLRESAGITVSRIGSGGHATSLFTRGSNSTHTLVLWNGIEVNNPYFGGYDWGQFSTAGVEQIEIVRGPFSALYGSDAVAGVVNILSAPARSGLRVAAETGGNGLTNGSVAASYVDGPRLFTVTLESRDDGGFARNDDFAQDTATAAVRWGVANGLTVGVTGRYNVYDVGIPTNLNAALDALVPTLRRRQEGSEYQVALPVGFTRGRMSYDLTLAQTRREDELSDPDDPFGLLWQTTRSTAQRARLTAHARTTIGTFVGGAEYEDASVDDVTSYGANFVEEQRNERSLFVEHRMSKPLGRRAILETSAGVRHDQYETFGSETSPRVALAVLLGNFKLRAGHGEAFRAPSIGELYSPFGGNVQLRAERSRSSEVGIDWRTTSGKLSATVFRARYTDLITNAGFTFANVGRASANGIEFSGEHRLGAVDAGLTYTYTDATADGTGAELLRRPRHSGSAFVGARIGAFDANVVLLHSGVRDDILPVMPFARFTTGAHTTADINVQYRTGRLTPYLKIENAADARYEEVAGYRSPGRRAIAGLRFAM